MLKMRELWVVIILLILILGSARTVYAEDQARATVDSPLELYWERFFGGERNEYCFAGTETDDGGYIMTGQTYSYGSGSSGVWLIKISHLGVDEWYEVYGGSDSDCGYDIKQTPDGGFIISGRTYVDDSYAWDSYLIKTDKMGNLKWEKTYGSSLSESGNAVAIAPDGGYIVTGSVLNSKNYNYDLLIYKTDNMGNVEWDFEISTQEDELGNDIIVTSEGDIVVTGITKSDESDGYGDVLILKLDMEGNEIWHRVFDNEEKDEGVAIQQTDDGGFIIGGTSSSEVWQYPDYYILKIDSEGYIQWDKTYNKNGDDYCTTILQTACGGYIAAGFTGSIPNSLTDIWLLKMDNNGNKQWEEIYDAGESDFCYDLIQTSGGDFVFFGHSDKSREKSRDFMAVRYNDMNERPVCKITSHENNQILYGSVTFEGTASDPDGEISYVEVRIGDGSWGKAYGDSEWTRKIETTDVLDGIYEVQVRAYDGSKFSELTTINVIINNNKPECKINFPYNLTVVKDTVILTGNYFDLNGSVEQIEVFVDNVKIGNADMDNNWTFGLDTEEIDEGLHAISVRAFDGMHYSKTDVIDLYINNCPPECTIKKPFANSKLKDVIRVSGSSSDDCLEIEQVDLKIDNGEWVLAQGTDIWSYEWNTENIGDGEHVIYVRAFDGYLYSDFLNESISVKVNNNSTDGWGFLTDSNNMLVFSIILILIVITLLIITYMYIIRRRDKKGSEILTEVSQHTMPIPASEINQPYSQQQNVQPQQQIYPHQQANTGYQQYQGLNCYGNQYGTNQTWYPPPREPHGYHGPQPIQKYYQGPTQY